MEVSLHFGRELKRYRLQADLTQEELAERIGVTRETVSQLERGVNTNPGNDILLSLERHLGLSRLRSRALLMGQDAPDHSDLILQIYRIAAIPDPQERRQAWFALPMELRQAMLQFVQDSLVDVALRMPEAGQSPDPR